MNLGRFRDTWQIWLILLLIALVVVGGGLWGQWRVESPSETSVNATVEAGPRY